jgi:hypothetical protein
MADNDDNQDNGPLENLMEQLKEDGMGLHVRLEIAKDAQTLAAGSKPLDVETKPESANAKKVSAQKKAQKSSESSYAEHSDKLKKNKDVIMISNR